MWCLSTPINRRKQPAACGEARGLMLKFDFHIPKQFRSQLHGLAALALFGLGLEHQQ